MASKPTGRRSKRWCNTWSSSTSSPSRSRSRICSWSGNSMATAQKIAILGGTGAQGSGLALRLSKAGHAVTIGSRDAAKAQTAAQEASARAGKAIAGTDNRGAAAAAEIVILAVPYAVERATVE